MVRMRRANKFTLQTLGFALIVIGVILLMAAIIGLNQGYNCPISGCGPEIASRIYWEIVTFWSGITFIAVGIILLFMARGMRPKMETDSVTSTQSPEPGQPVRQL